MLRQLLIILRISLIVIIKVWKLCIGAGLDQNNFINLCIYVVKNLGLVVSIHVSAEEAQALSSRRGLDYSVMYQVYRVRVGEVIIFSHINSRANLPAGFLWVLNRDTDGVSLIRGPNLVQVIMNYYIPTFTRCLKLYIIFLQVIWPQPCH